MDTGQRVTSRRTFLGQALGAAAAVNAAPARARAATEKVTFRLDWIPYGRHAPYYVALAKNFYGSAGLDVDVERNAWGRQLDSFEGTSDAGMPLVFIRAPRITRVGSEVEVVETLSGEPVMVRHGNVWGATFHPELAEGFDLHEAIFAWERERLARMSFAEARI